MIPPKNKSWVRRTFFGHCDALGVGVWSCPSFIFFIMGVVIIVSILTTYIIAERHADSEIVIAIVTALTIFLLVITQVLVAAFERVVRARQMEVSRTKEVLELKDQFVYLSVHDLSSAATAVKWGLKILEHNGEKVLSPAEHEIFSSIRTRNEQLIALVRQILLITRIERGVVALRPTTFPLANFLKDSMYTHWTKGKDASASHVGEIDARLPLITTDAELFGEVVSTLLFNARAYASHKAAVMAMHARMEGDNAFVMTVENNGDGIPAELQKHIFEKFWVDKSTGRIVRASFGLFIAQQIARMLGGNITFTSDQNITRFTLHLPLALPKNS